MANDPYSLGVICSLICFVYLVILSSSSVFETAARALVGAICSGIFLLVLALTNWQAFKPMAPLVAFVLGAMLSIAALMAWQPLARHRAISEARKHFPMASKRQLRSVASKILNGSRVTSFGWFDGEIIFGRGKHTLGCSARGKWRPIPTRDYLQEEQVLLKAIPPANSILTKDSAHELCINLYFNWSIDSFELQDTHISVTLSRRNEKITKRYEWAASAQAPFSSNLGYSI